MGHFGWKAQHASLQSFAADAYLNEMGITSPLQPNENSSNGNPVPDDGILDDEGADVELFALFMRSLKVPPRLAELANTPDAQAGSNLFNQVGCNGCHVTTTFVTPNPSPNGVPGGFSFNPFSDFAAHDMGSLGDEIGIHDGDTVAQARMMRTAPLWGSRFRNAYLHDGRAANVPAAIAAHDGQGKAAATAFGKLSAAQQHQVVQFVLSL